MKEFAERLMRAAAQRGMAEEIVLISECWLTQHAAGDRAIGRGAG